MNSEDSGGRQPVVAKVTLWQTTVSVLWSFFGVQSSAIRERDFTHGNPLAFIVVGFVLTAAFAAVLIGIVKLLIAGAGAG